MKRNEFQFPGKDQASIFAQSWQDQEQPTKANLIITHGHGEHSEWYSRLAQNLVPRGYNIYAWDMLGYGQSPGKRGYVKNFQDHSENLVHFINSLKNQSSFKNKPFFLIGHSMGGMITLNTIIKNPNLGQAGTCLSSPLIDIFAPPPAYKDQLARLLLNVLPQFTMASGTRQKFLSRDVEVFKSYAKDPLRTTMISPSTYLGILSTSDFIKKNAHKIDSPILFQLAGDDRIVSTSASEKIYGKISSPNKNKIIYPQAYHEIFNDICRQEVYDDLHHFLEGVLG